MPAAYITVECAICGKAFAAHADAPAARRRRCSPRCELRVLA